MLNLEHRLKQGVLALAQKEIYSQSGEIGIHAGFRILCLNKA